MLRYNDYNSYDNDIMSMELLGRGFYPAGPDMRDISEFSISLANNQSYSAMRTDYFGMFDCKLHFVFHDLPIPPPIVEPPESPSGYNFGDVCGLRDPERVPIQEYSIKRSVSSGGAFSYVRTPTDEYTSTITQRATTAKMAELMSYLNRVRGDTVMIRAKKNYWLFGPDNAMDGDLPAKLLDNTMTFIHENFNTWKTTIQLWKATGVAI